MPQRAKCEGNMKLQTAIAAPKGARWVSETVVRDPKTNRTVVDCLILTFDNLDDMMAHYGKDTVMHFATGTSFRVIQQGVWRLSLNGTVDQLCARIVAFRAGHRSSGVRTVTVDRFIGPNEKAYPTREAMAEAWREYYQPLEDEVEDEAEVEEVVLTH